METILVIAILIFGMIFALMFVGLMIATIYNVVWDYLSGENERIGRQDGSFPWNR